MKIVEEKVSINELQQIASEMFGNLIKAVVDIENEILVIDAELHSDQEALLLNKGSKQENLWGINIYPSAEIDDRIEFDSMINLRPSFGNNSRSVEDDNIRNRIRDIVNSKISK